MRKQLVIHAGGNKTGSSAIQKFLSMNIQGLRATGVVVPSADLTPAPDSAGQQVFAFQQLFGDARGRDRLEDAVRAVAAAEPEAHAIILSAENLAANPAAPTLFAGLVDEFDIRFIMYIRRQDDYLLSSWQQWYAKVQTDFWAWAVQNVGIMGNWDAYLHNWEQVVPSRQITVRVFERKRLVGSDVVCDFYDWLGLPQPLESWRRPDKDINLSMSDAVTELVKGNRSIFANAHDADFYNFVLKMTGDEYVKKGRRSSITFEQRMALLQRYSEGNRRIRQRYLPESQRLFTMPQEDDFEYVSSEQMREEQLRFLTSMIWGLHRNRQAPE